MRLATAAGITAALLLLVAGCESDGPKFVEVSGTVTLDGQPLKAGTVYFYPDGSAGTVGPASFGTIIDGKYELYSSGEQVGAIIGQHKVTVQGPEQISYANAPQVTDPVPQRYQLPETSGLVKEVKEDGENVINLELTTRRRSS